MSIDAAFGFSSPQSKQLASIDSTKYPDTNKDIQQNLIRLNQFVDYIASYLQVMQKGIDKNTQDPIAQIQGAVSDVAVLLGGGELLYGIDLGDLQYFLPAIGALLGFDGTTPFPINLFNAAEHFLLGYVVPLDSFSTVIEGIIDGWLKALGIDPAFIQAVNDLLDALQGISTDLTTLLTELEKLLNILGPMSGFGSIWNAVTTLLGGFSLDQLGGIIDPAFKALAPWIEELAVAVNQLDAILKAFTGGVVDVQGVLNFSQLFTPFINFFPTIPTSFNPLTAIEQWIAGALQPTNMLAPLVTDPTAGLGLVGFVPLENLAMEAIAAVVGGAQSLIDAILGVFGYAPGTGTADDVAQIFSNIFDFLGNPANFTTDIFNVVTAVENFITGMLHPTNLLAPMNPSTQQIFGINIPVLDAGTKLSGILGLAQIPTGIPQSSINITSIAASIVTGVLGGGQIPVLDAGTKLSGVLGLAQIPTGIPQSSVNITSIAAGIISGVLSGTNIPVLDAGTKLSGVLGLAQVPTGIPQSSVNITSIAASIITGVLGGGQIPVLDAGTKLSGIVAAAQLIAANIPNLPAGIITSGIFGGSQIPVLDAGTKLSGVVALAQIPTHIPQSSVDITSIAASIVTGLLSGSNIPVLDAGTKLSGVLGLAQVPTGIPQSSVNITSIAASIISGVLSGTNIPVLDAGTKLSGVLGLAQVPTGIPQSSVNITSIAASIVTGLLSGSNIPVLDAGTKLSGVVALPQIPTGIPQTNISNLPTDLANRVLLTTFQSKAQSAANLIIDPGFDNPNIWANEPGVMDTAQKINGTQSRRMTSTGAVQSIALTACGAAGTGPIWAAQPGEVYYLEASVFPKVGNVGGGQIAVIASAWDSTGVNAFTYILNPFFAAPPAAGAWTKISGFLTVPAGYDGIIPYLTLNSNVPVGDQFYFDRVVCNKAVRLPDSPDMQTLNDSVTNAFQGLSNIGYPFNAASNSVLGTSLPQSTGAMNAIYNNVVNAINRIQALSSQQVASNVSGVNVNINFANYPDGALPSSFTVTYSGPGTSTIGIKSGDAGFANLVNDNNRTAFVVYNVAPTNTDYQIVRGTMASAPSGSDAGGQPYIYAMGRVNSPSSPTTFVWARAYCTGFLTYKADVGCTVGGADTIFSSGINLTWSLDISVIIGANGNPRRYQAYSGTQLVFDYTEAGTTSQIGAGFRYWGCKVSMVRGNYGAASPGTISATSVSDNQPPTILGSYALMSRHSTTNVSIPASQNSALAAGFYDTIVESSPDITPATATNRFTVTIEGTYLVEASAIFVGSPAKRMGFWLNKNGSNYKLGILPFEAAEIYGSWIVYLKANDYVTLNTYLDDSLANNITGEATGAKAYYGIALLNRSLQ